MQAKLPGYYLLAVLLGGLSMVSPFSIDTFFPAFHAMERALQVDAWQLQQVLTAYMLPFAFASLVHGPLSDSIGRRPVMIGGMVLYTVGSVACMIAPNYEFLIAARVLQGVTAGVGVIVGRALIRDLYEGPRAQKLMNLTTMIFAIAPAVAPIIGGWVHVAFGWRSVFGVMVIFGLLCAWLSWWRLPETLPPTARIPFHARNLASTSYTVLRHPEFVMLALAAAVNFGSLACYIGSAPAIVEKHWHLGETSYWQLFLPVIAGILTGAFLSGRLAGRTAIVKQVWAGLALTAIGAASRVIVHLVMDAPPMRLQQVLLYVSAFGAQISFPVLTLRMLDLFPAARGTAAAAQSFVALLVTAAVLGIIAPMVLADLQWIAWTSLALTSLASLCWSLARRWHDTHTPFSA